MVRKLKVKDFTTKDAKALQLINDDVWCVNRSFFLFRGGFSDNRRGQAHPLGA